jgi:hypothetical protein
MESKRASTNPAKAYLPMLVGSYLIKRFDIGRMYPNKTKARIARAIVFIGLGIWSLASMLKFILEYIEYLDTEEGDRSLREYSNYYSSSVWPYI